MSAPQMRLTPEDIQVGANAMMDQLVGLTKGTTVTTTVAQQILVESIAAINERRGGDPLGTVMRSRNGAHAVRVRQAGAFFWQIVHPDGKVTESDGELGEAWQLVSRP